MCKFVIHNCQSHILIGLRNEYFMILTNQKLCQKANSALDLADKNMLFMYIIRSSVVLLFIQFNIEKIKLFGRGWSKEILFLNYCITYLQLGVFVNCRHRLMYRIGYVIYILCRQGAHVHTSVLHCINTVLLLHEFYLVSCKR